MADLGESLDNIEEGVEELKNTKFKLFGLSMTPTTIGAAFALVSSVIGALYGSFQVYNDYMEMKEQIQSYTAPDLSGLQEQISVLSEKVDSKLSQVESNVDVIKDAYRVELDDIKSDLDKAEGLIRDIDDNVAGTQRDLRNDVYGLEKRVNESLRTVDADVRKVRDDLEEKIRTVLENPLNDVE
jgi:peptidoglycan hydrolase CwlO-like protein